MAELTWRLLADFIKKHPRILLKADTWTRGRGRVHYSSWFATPPRPALVPDLNALLSSDMGACWIGHATVLLRIGQTTILTDPVFSDRVGPHILGVQVGPKRIAAPAISIRDLPPIDIVLLTHSHFDHLDLPSLHRLSKRSTLVTCSGLSDLVRPLRFARHIELVHGASVDIDAIRLTSVPTNHWGARMFVDTWRGHCGFLMEHAGRKVLFAGDTAATDELGHIGPTDLLCLGIGAYDPYVAAHATPEQAASIAESVGAKNIVAMHHSTFRLGHEPDDEPRQRLMRTSIADRVVIQQIGQTWLSPRQPGPGHPIPAN